MICCQLTLVNKLGLHARAAAKLASTAGRFGSKIEIGHSEKKLVDAKSVMSVMLLAASRGTTLHLRFEGEDENKAHRAIEQLISDRFGEGE